MAPCHPPPARASSSSSMRLLGPSALLAALIALIALLAIAGPAQAASTYTVTSFADSGSTCNQSACPSLRAAILAADTNPGSTIRLGAGTYKLGAGKGHVVLGGSIEISASLALIGAGSARTTIEQTDGVDGVLDVASGTVTISGVRLTGGTIAGGSADTGAQGLIAAGAGILNAGMLTLRDVAVSGNTAIGGSGGANESGNAAPNGGDAVAGILNAGGLTLIDSTVSGNLATGGAGGPGVGEIGGTGGIAVGGIDDAGETTPTVLTNSTISGNVAIGGAGGTTNGSSPGSTHLGDTRAGRGRTARTVGSGHVPVVDDRGERCDRRRWRHRHRRTRWRRRLRRRRGVLHRRRPPGLLQHHDAREQQGDGRIRRCRDQRRGR